MILNKNTYANFFLINYILFKIFHMSVFIGLIDRERLTDTRGRLSIHQKVVSDTIWNPHKVWKYVMRKDMT